MGGGFENSTKTSKWKLQIHQLHEYTSLNVEGKDITIRKYSEDTIKITSHTYYIMKALM